MKALGGFIFVMTCAYGLAKFLDDWLKKPEKKQLTDKVIEIYIALGTSDPRAVIQAPIQAISHGIMFIFGKRPYSLIAFQRYSLATLLLFVCASAVTTIQSNSPFTSDDLPWVSFDNTGTIIDAVDHPFRNKETLTPELKTASDNFKKAVEDALAKQTPEQRAEFWKFIERVRGVVKTIELYNNPTNRTLYTILFFPCIILVATGLNFTAAGFARQSIADMAEAKSLVSLFSLGVGNLIVMIFVLVCGFTLLCTITIPFSWIILWGLIVCGYKLSWLLACALLIPCLTTALFLGPGWIKILAGVIIAPDLIAIALSALAFILFPFRKALRWMLIEIMDRGTSYEKGFLTFCTPIIAAVLGLALWIAKLFNP